MAKLTIQGNRTAYTCPEELTVLTESPETLLMIAKVSGKQAAQRLLKQAWNVDNQFYRIWKDKFQHLKEENPALYQLLCGAFHLSVGYTLLNGRNILNDAQISNAYQSNALAQRYFTNAFVQLSPESWILIRNGYDTKDIEWRQAWVTNLSGAQAVALLICALIKSGWTCYRATLQDDLVRKIDLIAQPPERKNGGVCFQVKGHYTKASHIRILSGGRSRQKTHTFPRGVKDFAQKFRGSWISVRANINVEPATLENTIEQVIPPLIKHFSLHY
jgi:hypothetical protein